MRRVLVTGSSGLIGSEAATFFDALGWEVHGIDNNLRRDFFGPDGDTTANLERLRRTTRRFSHYDFDIRDREPARSSPPPLRGIALHLHEQQ
jgi:CDP-paratose 2-epimerase